MWLSSWEILACIRSGRKEKEKGRDERRERELMYTLIPALGNRQQQNSFEFEAWLVYRMRPYFQRKKTKHAHHRYREGVRQALPFSFFYRRINKGEKLMKLIDEKHFYLQVTVSSNPRGPWKVVLWHLNVHYGICEVVNNIIMSRTMSSKSCPILQWTLFWYLRPKLAIFSS